MIRTGRIRVQQIGTALQEIYEEDKSYENFEDETTLVKIQQQDVKNDVFL